MSSTSPAMAAALPMFVVAPLAASALLVLVRRAILERLLMVGVPAVGSVAGALLVWFHTTTPALAHQVGGFPPGVSIPFVSDTLSAVMLTVTGFVTAVCSGFLIMTGEDRFRFVPPLLLMLTAGVNGALLTGDLFNLFVFIEVMLLPSYALISVTGAWRRLGIGRLFVVVNLVTSTVLLIGVGLVYGTAGTVTLAGLAGAASAQTPVGVAVVVVLLALGVKAGMVPVHGWLPRSYRATSAGMMAVFSGLHTKVALYAMYRIITITYQQPPPWLPVLGAIVVFTVLVGAVSTYGNRLVRGALAFQMVAGVGHILLGLALFTPQAMTAGLFYLVHHVVTMGALLLCAGALEHTYGTGRMDRLHGLMRRDRIAAVIFALGLFSLVGLPPTSGLWGKVTVVQAAASADGQPGWIYVTAVLVGSLASLLALQRLWATVFWGAPSERYRPDDPLTGRGDLIPLPADLRVRAQLLIPAGLLATVSVGLFVGAGWALQIADTAATGLRDVPGYVAAVRAPSLGEAP